MTEYEAPSGRAKYAPAREDGLKPWVVAVSSWGRTNERIEWAATSGQAAYQAKGRQRYTYAKARRATVEDVVRLGRSRTPGGGAS